MTDLMKLLMEISVTWLEAANANRALKTKPLAVAHGSLIEKKSVCWLATETHTPLPLYILIY